MSIEDKHKTNFDRFQINPIKQKFNQFKSLTIKNLKLIFRDKQNYFWIFGYPLVFLVVFSLAFNTGAVERSKYGITIFNYDVEGVENPNYGSNNANVSLILIDTLNNTNNDPINELNESIWIATSFSNGTSLTEADAEEFLKKSWIDVIIYIPEDFSEKVNAGQPVAINITTIPDAVTQSVIQQILSSVMQSIVVNVNEISIPSINMDDPIEGEGPEDSFDYMGPGIIIMGVLVTISNTAFLFAQDKEKGMMRRLDSTPVKRENTLFSSFASMLVVTSIQIIVIMILLPIFGVYISPIANLLAVFFAVFLMTFRSIGLGLIVGTIAKSASAASGISWMFILPLQFLGGAFFTVPESVAQYIPCYYAINAVRQLLLYGSSLASVASDLWIVTICGVVSLLIGIIIFKKKSEI